MEEISEVKHHFAGPKIFVLGLGNLMRADDAAGMIALEALRADPRLPHEVTLVPGETLGLDLLYHVEGATHLMILDAVEVGEEPGTVVRFQNEEVEKIRCATSVHLLGMSDLLAAMKLLDCAPHAVVVIGVQPQTIDWGTELTPPVEEALPQMVEAALQQIHQWTGIVAERRTAS